MFELIKSVKQNLNEANLFQTIYEDATFCTPTYSERDFIFTVRNIGDTFKEDFLNRINSCHWQTIKAFYIRMAYDYDDRE
ncbi:hypothetical protein LGK97_17915 [Clostridium sp. CS001]|uniref:hypothetical protein n=1 Tax=Clostridium sp. CS001 TaxID=2880648 RepID=UPI001CF23F42|nr:hypothetical protein [Clostridium sp. CS001]MCB2291594.1 hypothetical protein [Clostridium sp. CS001]